MVNKSSALDRIEELSDELRQSRSGVNDLLSEYQTLVDNASAVLDATDASLTELEKLADMIESGEIEMDEHAEYALQYLYDTRGDVSDDTRAAQTLRKDVERAYRILHEHMATRAYVVSLARKVE